MKIICIISFIFLCSCSSQIKNQLNFNPQEPLRVAVLPIAQVEDDGKFVQIESRLIVDNLSLVSTDQKETPAQTVRKQILGELKKTSLDIVSPALIDIDLPHNGFLTPGGILDLEKLYKTDPKQLCTKFVNCDAVLYGKIYGWDRSYYAIQSVNTVDIELTLVSAKNNSTLFTSRGKDSDSRGITKGPTGFSSLVIEPIRGLDSDIIVELSQSVIAKMLKPLDIKERPEFLASEPPSIFAASHEALTSTAQKKEPLVVLMFGTPEQIPSFEITGLVDSVPMIERTPGHYYGEFIPLPGDNIENKQVIVSLQDKFGRITKKPITKN